MSIPEERAKLQPGMGFQSPLEVTLAPECEGWEELYPPHALFAEDRRAFEQSRFWFQDALRYAEPYYPFDAILLDYIAVNFNQTSARRFAVPTSLGIEQRILGGYVYLSPNSITDEATISARAELFAVRGGYYYEHWDELDRRWRENVAREIRELEALEVPELPAVEDEAQVTAGGGVASSHRLLGAYDRLLEGFDRVCNYHFELMNLGYGAYLALYELCSEAFPDISEMTIAKMVAGLDVVALRPDDELKRLAIRAVELRRRCGSPERPRRAGTNNRACGHDGRRAMAGRLPDGQGPVVLLLLWQRDVSPSSLVDRRPQAPDRDDRLLRSSRAGRRGYSQTAARDPR